MRQQKMSRMPVKSEGINQGVGENKERATFMTNEEMEKKKCNEDITKINVDNTFTMLPNKTKKNK